MIRKRILALAAVCAAATLATAGCSSGSKTSGAAGRPGAGGSSVGSGGAGGSPTSQSLPLDAYMFLSDADGKTVQQATAIATRDCMKRFGFDYQMPAAQAEPPLKHTGLGPDDPKLAAVWGYHSPPDPAQQAPADLSNDDGKDSPQQMVLTGTGPKAVGGQTVPVGGCKQEAEDKIDGPVSTADMSVLDGPDGPKSTLGGAAASDPKVQAALKAWSTCMKQAGFDYTTTDQPEMQYLRGTPGQVSQPSAPEIATAVADVKCKLQTNLNGIWFQTESALQNAYIEQNATALNQIKQMHEDEVKRAAAIVGAGG